MVALLASIMMRFVPVPQVWVLPYSVILIHATVTPFLLMTFRLIIRGIYNTYMNPGESLKPTLIFGAGELGRDPIWLNLETVAAGLKDTVVLVTGAAGSIGSEIVRQLMAFACR